MKIDYFSHDTKARSDSKLVSLAMRQGMEGLGVYWCIVEMLYENDGKMMRTECERIAYELRTHSDCINSVIYEHELFQWDDLYFWSNSVLNRLKTITEKSDKARQSATKRWENANAMRTQCEGNAIKEKESKVNKINIGDELPTEEAQPEATTKPKREKFIAPSLNECIEYFEEQKQTQYQAEAFFNYYESINWKRGKNKIEKWKLAAAGWIKRDYNNQSNLFTPQTTVKPVKASLHDD